MEIPGGWELVVIALLVMVLFGYKKLPDATRSLGKSVRIFKAETKGLRDDDTPETPAAATTTTTVRTEPTVSPTVEAPREVPEAPRLAQEQPAQAEPHRP